MGRASEIKELAYTGLQIAVGVDVREFGGAQVIARRMIGGDLARE
jgi:hypothetical protein